MNNTKSAPSPTTPGITGYRNLSQEEKDLMNEVKAFGQIAEALIDKVRAFHITEMKAFDMHSATPAGRDEQLRLTSQGQIWRGRATDDLQDGLMKLNRAIARPTTFA